mmetsp:Transcript_43000/g.78158  ORF Transcript_43000/g.78158 Transcript_43000/m.78158 type:complete len:273 (-) Transcript_43000:35-853(-)
MTRPVYFTFNGMQDFTEVSLGASWVAVKHAMHNRHSVGYNVDDFSITNAPEGLDAYDLFPDEMGVRTDPLVVVATSQARAPANEAQDIWPECRRTASVTITFATPVVMVIFVGLFLKAENHTWAVALIVTLCALPAQLLPEVCDDGSEGGKVSRQRWVCAATTTFVGLGALVSLASMYLEDDASCSTPAKDAGAGFVASGVLTWLVDSGQRLVCVSEHKAELRAWYLRLSQEFLPPLQRTVEVLPQLQHAAAPVHQQCYTELLVASGLAISR